MKQDMARVVWYGRGPGPVLARAALWVPSLLFRLGVAVRNALYDARLLPIRDAGMPVISVGNLTVGGTGKSPVAAWLAGQLTARGARPAIVLRGYGDDEPEVHRRLNPGLLVIASPDRARGIARARDGGATIVVLDDAFQHRRVARSADIVLVAADHGLDHARPLPAGPYRELPGALRRASLVLVTRKTATMERAVDVLAAARAVGGIEGAVVSLAPGALRAVRGANEADSEAERPLSDLGGRRVLLITGIGEPGLLAAQLAAAGAEVELHAYPDHHAFSDAELMRAASAHADLAVCTLKDAVKLEGRWPGPAPLWYVSQGLTVERGREALDGLLEHALAGGAPNLKPPVRAG